jgi:oligosaccharide repeat unit polymerase
LSRSTIPAHPTAVLLIQTVLCVSAVLTAVLLHGSANTAVLIPLCTVITVTFAWSLWSWRHMTGTLVDPYGMFMTSLFLFNAGQAPLEVLGMNGQGLVGGKFDDETLIATLLLVCLGLSFTHLGALLAVRSPPMRLRRPRFVVSGQALRATGWVLLSVSAVPSWILLSDTATRVVEGGYIALFQREASIGIAAGPQVLAVFLVPAAIFLLAGAEGRRREVVTAALVISGHTMVQLFLGFRSTAIMPACAFAWLWDRLEWKLNRRWMIAVGLLLTLVVLPGIRQTRDLIGVERISPKILVDSYTSLDNPIVSTVSEMGGSMATVAYTYVLVPSSRAFDNGVGYAYAMLTVLPNLFWPVHPTISHGTASDWLISTVDPFVAGKQGGMGYSCIAEAYLNFGWTGVVIVMSMVGFVAGKLGVAARQEDCGRLALVATFTAFALRFPRDESTSLVRAFVWYSFLPYVSARLVSRLGQFKRVPRTMPQPQPVTRCHRWTF